MSDPLSDSTVLRLREQVAQSLVFEDVAITLLAEGVVILRENGEQDAAEKIEVQIRRHRVSHIKRRAIMGAHGIEI